MKKKASLVAEKVALAGEGASSASREGPFPGPGTSPARRQTATAGELRLSVVGKAGLDGPTYTHVLNRGGFAVASPADIL